jgi:hypothetical protein
MTDKAKRPTKDQTQEKLRESARKKELDRGAYGEKAVKEKEPPPPTGKVETRRNKDS